jgi:hypothetical protein
MATIELYGREVIPRVKELLADTTDEPALGNQRPATANGVTSRV